MAGNGIGPLAAEQKPGCPGKVAEFHLWYVREKGLIHREAEADINQDGVVRLLDVQPFVQIVTGG